MLVMWAAIVASVALAIAVSGYRPTRLPFSGRTQALTALGLLIGGLALRWIAILTLGRFFTAKVSVHQDHQVVEAGPYRYIRHPSYTGLLIAFVGLGVYFGNWISIAVLVVPIILAVLHRIRLEESVLAEALGADYARYIARTKRLIPLVW